MEPLTDTPRQAMLESRTLDEHANESSRLVHLRVLLVLMLCAVAILVLVSMRLGVPAWKIVWIEDGSLTRPVLQALDQLRYELSALALVGLNFVLYVFRSGRDPVDRSLSIAARSANWSEPVDFSRVPPDTDVLDQTIAMADDERPTPQSSTTPAQRVALDGGSANAAAQLQIATDEVTRLRKELVDCREQLAISSQAKSQFLANMSHELRTPMNGIMGMTDLLLSGSLSAREERFVNSIASSSNTLLAIINDLLDFSKIESGILQLENGRFSVRDCVEDVCASLANSAHGKGIELICYVDANVPQQMDGDPDRVRQILNNLVNNAIAFTHEGEVVVRVTRKQEGKGKSVYLCDVQDTGEGITPEMQIQLFEAFTQADPSNTRVHSGIGMGLAISKQLVSLMNGTISFRSRLGEGTRFSFTMELEDVAEEVPGASRRRSLQGARVLVVDDNETNRTILYHQLSNWGVLVETVESGEIALEALRAAHDREQGFDVLILDLHMPEMDGIQLARAIQAEPDFCHIQSIMLTSAILQLDGMELRKLGIHKYVSKPARQSVLHDSLASLMPSEGNSVPPRVLEPVTMPARVKARVLLVEDNPVNQDVAMEMLEQLGCEVTLAADGEDAVEKARSEKYDIVLMDCQMPALDGYEATRQLKTEGALNALTPVVALTAYAMDGDREKCLSAGMADYVSKPVRTQMLSHMIDKWVARADIEPFDKHQHSKTPALITSGGRDDDLTTDRVEKTEELFKQIPGAAFHDGDTSGKLPVAEPITAETGSAEDADEIALPATAAEVIPQSSDEREASADQDAAATDSADEASESVINLKAIDTIRGLQRPGKACLLSKVVSVYFDKTPELIATMETALQNNDLEAVAACAHSLKSSSAYLGADTLSRRCLTLESAIKEGEHQDIERLVAGFEEEYAAVSSELGGLIQAA